MEKANKKKIPVICAVLAAAVAVIIAVVILIAGKREAYRIIKIYEVDGSAVIRRDNIGELKPYNNMVLESGDNVTLDTGTMTLRLDDDKYVYVEEKTEFTIVASGSKENSKTYIDLKSGAITNEIQNKLSDESAYEINTPNSTMAVRGTIYRVEVYYDENNICYTKVSVFQGRVDTRLLYPDGSVAEEEMGVEQGTEVIIYEDSNTTDYLEVRDIDYSELPEKTLLLLAELTDEGKDLGVTSEELREYIGQKGPFTVTFVYNGVVFGRQIVEKGACAEQPTLMPSAFGSWDFDFNTPIMKDTEIIWK